MPVSAPTTLPGSFTSAASGTTSGAVAVGAAVAGGTFVIVPVMCSSITAVLTLSDSGGNTWTKLGNFATAAAGTAATTALFYTTLNATGWTAASTITVNNSVSGSLAWWADTLTGVNTASPIAIAPTANAPGTASAAWAAPAISPAVGDLGYAFGTSGGGTTWSSLTAGWTQDQSRTTTVSNVRALVAQYRVTTATGSVTPVATITSNIWTAVSLSFAAAAVSIRRPPTVVNRAAIMRANF